jgi:hypothetical protein
MKKWIQIPLLGIVCLLLLLMACRKKEMQFVESGKKLTGSWKISKVVRNGEDLTAQYDFSAFRIAFQDSSYAITNPVPFVVSKNGKWAFDDPQYPMELSFRAEGTNTAVKPLFKYPVVKGHRSLILTFSPGCASNKYEDTLEPVAQ